ncbi:hypothetical protein [Pseudomonas phage KPP25]|uniref:Uncharacterized protein n=1 Tax=Pseudomonas phage KPP25 TaxID=1462608 RepID=X5IGE1_BPKP2|nr:hypothetical protein FF13_gp31 [Pseudomonas phage KPP25]BAO58503.1 hypothetical protein [Pseudomonas phage KPP25]
MRVRDVLFFAIFAFFVFIAMAIFVYAPAKARKAHFEACSAQGGVLVYTRYETPLCVKSDAFLSIPNY